MPKLFRIGLAVLVLGAASLVGIIVTAELRLTADPNPNPVGPGLLFFFTFGPGLILTGLGLAQCIRRRRSS